LARRRADPGVDPARRAALEQLERISRAVEERAGLGPAARVRPESARDRALIKELVHGVCRHWSLLDHYLARFVRRGMQRQPIPIRNILRLGAYQLCFMERAPEYAAIDQAVRLARERGFPRHTGFVNAVLRNLARARGELEPPESRGGSVEEIALYYSHPQWLVERWAARFGLETARAICRANNQPVPLTLRCRSGEPAAIREELEAAGVRVSPDPVLPAALHCTGGAAAVFLSEPFRKGRIQIQDASSQLVTPLFSGHEARRILDACCGPGGKTVQLVDQWQGRRPVVAVDREAAVFARLEENTRRMSCRGLVRPIRADLLAGVPLRPGSFDALLLDAPCSGLGMIGRHPEARWNRDARMIAKLAERQQRLLAAVAELAAPGARLVYSTCSFEKEETIEVIATCLQSGAPFRLAPIRDVLPPEVTALSLSEDWLLVLPEGGLRSGYFAALLERTR